MFFDLLFDLLSIRQLFAIFRKCLREISCEVYTNVVLKNDYIIQTDRVYLCAKYQNRSCDNTLENCFFQISDHSSAYVHIFYKKTNDQVSLGPQYGVQNIKAKVGLLFQIPDTDPEILDYEFSCPKTKLASGLT